MPKKVSLNVLVSPKTRNLVKIASVEEGVTMAALIERIIVEWGNSHLIDSSSPK